MNQHGLGPAGFTIAVGKLRLVGFDHFVAARPEHTPAQWVIPAAFFVPPHDVPRCAGYCTRVGYFPVTGQYSGQETDSFADTPYFQQTETAS